MFLAPSRLNAGYSTLRLSSPAKNQFLPLFENTGPILLISRQIFFCISSDNLWSFPILCSETDTCYVVQAGCEFMILLQLPKCQHYRCALSYLARVKFDKTFLHLCSQDMRLNLLGLSCLTASFVFLK